MIRTLGLSAILATLSATAGAQVIAFSETHDSPPNQFTASSGSGPSGWILENLAPIAHSGSGFWSAANESSPSDYYLTSPTITYQMGWTGPLALSIWHQFDFEEGFDGGVIEMSVNGGAFSNIGAGAFTLNGYTGTISATNGSPIAGEQAFTGTSPGFSESTNTGWINSAANLTGLAPGDTFQFRFRAASDATLGNTGWMVDDVTIVATQIPEPSALAMLLIGGGTLFFRRKRRKV